MTKEVYLSILKNHASKLCRNYLSELKNDKIVERMIWPPQSSDLSHIELL